MTDVLGCSCDLSTLLKKKWRGFSLFKVLNQKVPTLTILSKVQGFFDNQAMSPRESWMDQLKESDLAGVEHELIQVFEYLK